jgi:hypothetical protein
MSGKQRTEYDDHIDDAIDHLISGNDAHALITGSWSDDSGMDAKLHMASKGELTEEEIMVLHGVLFQHHAEALSDLTETPISRIAGMLLEDP